MKKLDVSAVTTTTGLPVKSGSLEHIQSAYQEAISEALKSVIGFDYDPTKVYLLFGCENSGSGNNYNVSAGSVFFNGEVYLVPAAVFTISNPNVAVGVIQTSFFSGVNADPVEFTDGTPRNIHQIRQIVLQAGLSGSGAGNYLDWRRANRSLGKQKIEMFMPTTGNLADDFDLTTGLGISVAARGYGLCDGQGGRANLKGRFVVGYDKDDADYNTPGETGGAKTTSLAIANIPEHDHFTFYDNGDTFTGTALNNNNYPVRRQGAGGGVGNNNYEYNICADNSNRPNIGRTSLTGSSSVTPVDRRPPYYSMVFVQPLY